MITLPESRPNQFISHMSTAKGVVYGLHAFLAENEDEISFAPGEEVVVLEKDDQYGDGWWQVSSCSQSHAYRLKTFAPSTREKGHQRQGGRGRFTFSILFHVTLTRPLPRFPSQIHDICRSSSRPLYHTRLNGLQGRNKAGHEGLFPVSYTSPEPPVLGGEANTLAPPNTSNDVTAASNALSPNSPQIHLSSPAGSIRSLPRTGSQSPLRRNSSHGKLNDDSNSVDMARSTSSAINQNIAEIETAINQLNVGSPSTSAAANAAAYSNGDATARSVDEHGMGMRHPDVGGAEGGDDYDEVGWSVNTRKKLAEKAINENKRREARERELEDQRRAREEQDMASYAGGVPEGVEFSDESDEDDENHHQHPESLIPAPLASTSDMTAAAEHRQPQPLPIIPGVPPNQILSANPESVLPPTPSSSKSTSQVDTHDQTRRRASIPVEPLVISKNTPPTSSPSLDHNRKLPASTAPPITTDVDDHELTPAARSSRAADAASLQPSALAKEPSPFHTVIPDQPEPENSLTQQHRGSIPSHRPAVASTVDQTLPSPPAEQHRTIATSPAPIDLAPPLDLGTLPAQATSGATSLRQQQSYTNIVHTASPTSGPNSTVVTPVRQLASDPFDQPHSTPGGTRGVTTPSNSSLVSPRASASSPGPGQTQGSSGIRRPGSFSQNLGACGIGGDPMDWSIEDVVEWAKRRGFDESIWSKFLGMSISLLHRALFR